MSLQMVRFTTRPNHTDTVEEAVRRLFDAVHSAATGLVLFFTGAVAAHFRARVFYNLAFPGGFLACAIASLALAVAVV